MLVSKGLRLALKSVPSIILFCKAYLGAKASFFLPSFPGALLEWSWFGFAQIIWKDETMHHRAFLYISICRSEVTLKCKTQKVRLGVREKFWINLFLTASFAISPRTCTCTSVSYMNRLVCTILATCGREALEALH